MVAFLWAGAGGAAEIRRVPESYPSVLAAYAAAQSGDVIEISTNLSLEIPPVLFANIEKRVTFRPASGRVIITSSNGPPNDTFADRAILSGENPSTTAFNYSAALAPEFGDPLPRAAGGNALAFGRSLWFEWTAPSNGLVIVNSVGSDFDTLLDVFVGPIPPLPPVASGWFGFNEVGFNAQTGVTYEILVGGQNRAFGQVQLNISYTGPPPNDLFVNAHSLTGAVSQVQGSTFGSSREEPDEPNHAGVSSSNSVWFTWTAPVGDALFPRPVTISTAGSDFDTVLAVYEGTHVTALTLKTNNNDHTASLRESQVTFAPVPGATYRIALDGAAPGTSLRAQVGNYLLRLDYSLVNTTVRNLVQDAPTNQQVGFRAELTVRDWGFAPTAPLRVRLAARAGRDFAGVHRASVSNEVTLTTFTVPNGTGLLPNETSTLNVSGTCPAPIVNNAITNIWGVFAVVEEEFIEDLWVPVDLEFLLYGFVPETGAPILSYGVGRPVPPTIAPNELNVIQGIGVRASNFVTEFSTNSFSMIAQLDTGGERWMTNRLTWSGTTGVSLSTNGVLHMGAVTASTSFAVTGRYYFNGSFRTKSDVVPVYRRPSLRLFSAASSGLLSYEIRSDFAGAYALERRPSLTAPASFTNLLGWLTAFPATKTITNATPGFYRLNVRPPE